MPQNMRYAESSELKCNESEVFNTSKQGTSTRNQGTSTNTHSMTTDTTTPVSTQSHPVINSDQSSKFLIGCTQQQLADLSDLSVSTVKKYLKRFKEINWGKELCDPDTKRYGHWIIDELIKYKRVCSQYITDDEGKFVENVDFIPFRVYKEQIEEELGTGVEHYEVEILDEENGGKDYEPEEDFNAESQAPSEFKAAKDYGNEVVNSMAIVLGERLESRSVNKQKKLKEELEAHKTEIRAKKLAFKLVEIEVGEEIDEVFDTGGAEAVREQYDLLKDTATPKTAKKSRKSTQ